MVAAWVWLFGAAVYLVCEAIAAARFPGYSYVDNYISELGVLALMNVGFMVHGSLFFVGAIVVSRSIPGMGWAGWSFVLAASANAVGNILVGAFRSGDQRHVVGAGLAIVGGNIAVVIAGIASRRVSSGYLTTFSAQNRRQFHRLGLNGVYQCASVVLGVAGLICLAVLILDRSRLLPVGLVERGSVYPIIVWELMTAAAILTGCGRCSRQ